ncbi:MAG: RhuM family protein, partial [Treponema sp.]|nr:RhuM family protein [Treponema sp.]
KPMKMQDWIAALDNQIVAHQRKILEGKCLISHEQAVQKAEKEYDLFRQKELANLKSDFDLFLQDVSKIEMRKG